MKSHQSEPLNRIIKIDSTTRNSNLIAENMSTKQHYQNIYVFAQPTDTGRMRHCTNFFSERSSSELNSVFSFSLTGFSK